MKTRAEIEKYYAKILSEKLREYSATSHDFIKAWYAFEKDFMLALLEAYSPNQQSIDYQI